MTAQKVSKTQQVSKTAGSALANSNPQSRFILLDFFAYSCPGWTLTIPKLKQLQKLFNSPQNPYLQIIGVHSPELFFEKADHNLQQAIAHYKLNWPILHDNSHELWTQFNNKFLPTRHLITPSDLTSPAPTPLLTQHGTDAGGFAAVVSLLFKNLSSQEVLSSKDQLLFKNLSSQESLDFNSATNLSRKFQSADQHDFFISQEIPCGHAQNPPVQNEQLPHNAVYNFSHHPNLPLNNYSLTGQFAVYNSFLETVNYNSIFSVKFRSNKLLVVLEPLDETVLIEVTVNGKPLLKKHLTADHQKDSQQLRVDFPRTYQICQNLPSDQETLLELKPFAGNFRIYTLAF